jgi:hypothetical protein
MPTPAIRPDHAQSQALSQARRRRRPRAVIATHRDRRMPSFAYSRTCWISAAIPWPASTTSRPEMQGRCLTDVRINAYELSGVCRQQRRTGGCFRAGSSLRPSIVRSRLRILADHLLAQIRCPACNIVERDGHGLRCTPCASNERTSNAQYQSLPLP